MLTALLLGTVLLQGPAAPPEGPPAADQKQVKAEQQHQKDLQSDTEMGKKFAEQVEKEEKLSTNEEMQNRVKRVGADIAAIAQVTPVDVIWGDKRLNRFNYTFKVLQDPPNSPGEVNAFSLPGGYIYVYEGLMKYVESDDELAAVLAHEVSHAEERHLNKLAHEQSKLQLPALIPVLVAIASGKADAIGATIMIGTNILASFTSKWSVQAEQAADHGGIQYLAHSKYNATGMLTFMERLAQDEHNNPATQIDWGIYRTHPPSRDRADAIIADMRKFNLAIQRSFVSARFRTEVRPGKEGGVEIWFNKRRLYTFGGTDALKRADDASLKLNAFFDQTPQMFDVSATDQTVYGKHEPLFDVDPEDASVARVQVGRLAPMAADAIRGSLFSYAFSVWRN